MYLVVIGWLYVVLMMSVAEASNTTGTVLGAIVTFFLYGLMPLTLVVYLMRTPQRRKARKAQEAEEERARLAERNEQVPQVAQVPSAEPDTGRHATGAAESDRVAPVREEPR